MDAVNLWVDVTTLLGWRGHATGIGRTVAELLHAWLAAAALPLRLCRYDAGADTFREVPADVVRRSGLLRRDAAPPGAGAVPRPLSPAAHAPPWELQEAKRHFLLGLKSLGRFGRHVGRRFRHRLRRSAGRLASALCGRPAPPFAPGDILFLPGADWEGPSAAAAVRAAKEGCAARVVYLLYDVIPWRCPHLCSPRLAATFGPWARQALGLADLVLTISECSRADLAALAAGAGLPLPPVEVVRLGDELSPVAPARPRGLPGGPFALAVGTIDRRKNQALLHQLWRRLVERHGERVPPLVLAGQRGWGTDEVLHDLQADPPVRGRVVPLLGATDAELRWLYGRCLFSLFPSHYEGWGLPVAEALAQGKYCVASSTSSLPEVGGALTDYADPLDLPAWQGLVERALFEPGFLPGREARARDGFRPTPWDHTAQQALRAFERRGLLPQKLSKAVREVA